MSMFCPTELAARLERAEAGLIAAAVSGARPIGGGYAAYASPGSPLNKVAGLGFADPPTEAGLDDVERWFAAAGSPVQAEVATLADPAVAELLTARGYRLAGCENVLGCVPSGQPAAAEVEVREVSTAGAFQEWLDVVADAVMVDDVQGVPSHESFARDIVVTAMLDMARAGLRHYLALRDGVPAGGASLRIADGVAQLTGAATLPDHRRRGVQQALLAARLRDAAAEGAGLATITTQPGSKSHQNAQRQGFDLLYTRLILVKD
ncbi:GNAT family N-acetyltransferase [Dactylosporangium sp. CS-033363]|uniref:GNAT family N-acetyltransferase n=1 Tax=Dactylosporangium sp. CS-033363 TaxID=3239935 RepID=UPI003D8D9330